MAAVAANQVQVVKTLMPRLSQDACKAIAGVALCCAVRRGYDEMVDLLHNPPLHSDLLLSGAWCWVSSESMAFTLSKYSLPDRVFWWSAAPLECIRVVVSSGVVNLNDSDVLRNVDSFPVLRYLISAGADVHNTKALIHLCKLGNLRCAMLLARSGYDVNRLFEPNNHLPFPCALHTVAANNGCCNPLRMARFLLENGADPNLPARCLVNGKEMHLSPLTCCAFGFVRGSLQGSADVNATINMMKLLVAHGAVSARWTYTCSTFKIREWLACLDVPQGDTTKEQLLEYVKTIPKAPVPCPVEVLLYTMCIFVVAIFIHWSFTRETTGE